jgi:wobble nucleotide-excising tRNase
VDQNPFWDLLILDDPVQSMDDNHSSNLVDIIAEICKVKKKQVIILTHEKTFSDVIKNKFYYDEHLYYSFSEGGKDGPKIELIKGTLESYLMRAQKLASGNQDDINDAGVNLRKAIENFCYTLLVIKHGRSAKAIQKLELDDLFSELEKESTFDKQDLADLRTVRQQTDFGAHGNIIKNIPKADIDRGVSIVDKIAHKYL